MNNQKIRNQLRELNTIYKETDAIYGEFAKQSGLPDCAFWLMYSIYEAKGRCTQKEIRDQWTLSKQTVNSALKGLGENGYITLASTETDKRSKYIALTEKGVEFARENIDIVFEAERRALQKMTCMERDAMLESTRKYQTLFRDEMEYFLKNK